jgi:hypothetical protein
MARKKKRRLGTTLVSDEKLIENVERDAPDLLATRITEEAFGTVVDWLLVESSQLGKPAEFYCRKCREYHPKSHPHCRNQ